MQDQTKSSVAAALKRAAAYIKQRRKQITRRLAKFAAIAICVLVVLWLVLTYVVGITEVNGTSMSPTLQTGNVLVVWKLPQTWAKVTGGQYIPKRGDIIILNDTDNSGEQWVKRVIALPTESIKIADNNVRVFNTKDPQGFNPDALPFGKALPPTQGTFGGQVGDGQVFVMGDNRNLAGSIDSRSSLGNVPSSYIVGQVVLRILPLGKISLF